MRKERKKSVKVSATLTAPVLPPEPFENTHANPLYGPFTSRIRFFSGSQDRIDTLHACMRTVVIARVPSAHARHTPLYVAPKESGTRGKQRHVHPHETRHLRHPENRSRTGCPLLYPRMTRPHFGGKHA